MTTGAVKVAEFANETKLLLICVNETYPELKPYDAVRYSWKISLPKAAQADYVLAVWRGDIVGVFGEAKWLPAEKVNFRDISDERGNWKKQKGRFGFHGNEAPNDIQERYLGKRIPSEWRHKGNPIRYVNF